MYVHTTCTECVCMYLMTMYSAVDAVSVDVLYISISLLPETKKPLNEDSLHSAGGTRAVKKAAFRAVLKDNYFGKGQKAPMTILEQVPFILCTEL